MGQFVKQLKAVIKRLIKPLIWICGFILLSVFLINVYVVNQAKHDVYTDLDDIPEADAIIVLGAYVRGDNLSLVLEDRIKAALELYEDGKAPKLLLSGDHGQVTYDEVNSMRKYVLENSDIAEADIFLDHAGFDTYDSMYRAKEIFEIENAIIVTQAFHVDRAVYIARELGIDAVGFSVNQDKYKTSLQTNWYLREYLSRVKAFLDVIFHSKPKYLGDVIPITGDGRLSWDEFDD